MKEINVGDKIYKIFSYENKLYVQPKIIEKITQRGRIICGFQPAQGVKITAINQFTRTYFAWWIRGHYLNQFNCFSLEYNLIENISLFRKRFKKVVGYDLPQGLLYI